MVSVAVGCEVEAGYDPMTGEHRPRKITVVGYVMQVEQVLWHAPLAAGGSPRQGERYLVLCKGREYKLFREGEHWWIRMR